MKTQRGFTVLELIFVVATVAILATLGFGLAGRARAMAYRANCTSNLHQLGIVVQLYLNDHDNTYFPYKQKTAAGTVWYFGLETSSGGIEGERTLDRTASPLYPYFKTSGRIEVCPAFNYDNALYKPKFKGASWAYGYNWHLGDTWRGRYPLRSTELSSPTKVVVFADCAQANDFQAPATARKPLLEEFYIISDTFKTIHFRHDHEANFLYADGHVESHKMLEGTRDNRMKSENLGRITPEGSTEYLE